MNRFRAAISDSYRYWQIVRYQAYASLRNEIARTYLGVFWWLLEPTLAALVMYFVVAVLFKGKSLGFLLVGTFAFQWFSNSAALGANSIVQRATLMQSIYLPKILFPIIAVVGATWKFLFAFALLIACLVLSAVLFPPAAALPDRVGHVSLLALPLVLLLHFALNLSVALPLSVWIPYFRDGNAVIAALTQFLGFASGIFFSPRDDLKPEHAWAMPWFNHNPITILLDAYRDILLAGRWPEWDRLGFVLLFAVAGLSLGTWLLRRLDLELPKVSL